MCGSRATYFALALRSSSLVQAAFCSISWGKPVPDIDGCPGTALAQEWRPQVQDWSESLLIAVCV